VIDQPCGESEVGHVRITDQFDVGIRPPVAQSPDGGKREDEISNRPAAEDEKACFLGHGYQIALALVVVLVVESCSARTI